MKLPFSSSSSSSSTRFFGRSWRAFAPLPLISSFAMQIFPFEISNFKSAIPLSLPYDLAVSSLRFSALFASLRLIFFSYRFNGLILQRF
jgi:hypothetical protein